MIHLPTRGPCRRLLPGLASGLIALLLGAQAGAAERPMAFRSLGLEDGLSQSTVNASLQDSRGFMWFATENGLNRYDGYTMTRFLRDADGAGGLASDFIWALVEDARGDLWLASAGAGPIRWRRETGRFETVLSAGQLAAEPGRRQARALLRDAAGRIWVASRGAGLLQFSADGRLERSYTTADGLASNEVTALLADGRTALWVGGEAGLDRLDISTGQIRPVLQATDAGRPLAISALSLDASGGLWVGSFESGLWQRSALGGAFRVHRASPGRENALSSDRVRALHRDRNGRLWVATEAGLNLWRDDLEGFTHYRHDAADRYSLADDRLMSLYEDASGLLWVGSRAGGVSLWNSRSWQLGARHPPELAGAAVLAFAEDGEGGVWVGSYGAPLMRLDAAGQWLETFSPDAGYPDIGTAPTTALLRDAVGRLWIGTMGNGLHRYDPASGELLSLRQQADREDSLAADGIMSLLDGQDGTIWVGSFGGGLHQVDADNLQVRRVPGAGAGSGGSRATALALDGLGRLWVGTDGEGLLRLDAAGQSLERIAARALPSDTVYAVLAGVEGDLWVGTADAGLARLDPQDGRLLRRYTLADGLSNNVINGIRQDASGQLWLSSNGGLMRLDPASGTISRFHRTQGVSSEEFNFGAHFRAADGRLYFGGAAGFNGFDPAAVEVEREAPRLVLTGVEKFNQPARLAQSYSDLRRLDLRHDDDVLTFEYALMDFAMPQGNRYSVKLEGFDRDWSAPSPRRRSTYTNLDAGDYRFRVRAVGSDGREAGNSLDLVISVPPAPWASPWAYLLYACLLALALVAFLRWRLHEQLREARIRQLAYYDKVTGLPNRELFGQRLDAVLLAARQTEQSVDVICLRVGPLRELGHTLGHASVDDVMRELSARISQRVFGTEGGHRDLARLDDESFVLFVRRRNGAGDGMVWARRLLGAVQEPLAHAGHKVVVPGVAGVASYPGDGHHGVELIEFARAAAQAAVGTDSGLRHYAPDMTSRALQRLDLEADLRDALAEDALELHLQGKFNGAGELVGAEALCRWTHPELGPVPPGEFVGLAEESSLINELDAWMVRRVCALLESREKAGSPPLSIAVNVSASTFASGKILSLLEASARGRHFDPGLLELEITESALVRDVDAMIASLRTIKSRGHSLALDDFGTGYSSLSYLQRFSVDKLKIDRAFVTDIEMRRDQRRLCASIIALARSLGLKTVAEGVENARQQRLLVELGCEELQGFYLHRPQEAESFSRALPTCPPPAGQEMAQLAS